MIQTENSPLRELIKSLSPYQLKLMGDVTKLDLEEVEAGLYFIGNIVSILEAIKEEESK